MYRIAVIQNEVEMQHSGYVDNIQEYKDCFQFPFEVSFKRFSSVNIKDLFREGENHLLDFDCLIMGTNATNDTDVYIVLKEEKNRELLATYIDLGKGLLICSQKKLDIDQSRSDKSCRITSFLPEKYEYRILSRPKGEDSADGFVKTIDIRYSNDFQRYLLTQPYTIDNEMIDVQCSKNNFQKHYYRDYISPINNSSYYSVLVDDRDPVRNIMMVASPQKREKIVITTMALDWAGHYKLIENIISYIMVGIPKVAYVNSKGYGAEEFSFMEAETKLSKIPYATYASIDDLKNSPSKHFHSIFVFSPAFDEKTVADYWSQLSTEIKQSTKLFYYKKIGEELVLETFSQHRHIDAHKQEVEIWLKSKYVESYGLWDESFWKTYDVLVTLNNLDISIAPFLKGVFVKINEHYRNGSYDGVLAPTCGLLEILSIIEKSPEYQNMIHDSEVKIGEVIDWLVEKYLSTSSYNQKFIIRSFSHARKIDVLETKIENFKTELKKIAIANEVSSKDQPEIDLMLDMEVCLICCNFTSDWSDTDLKRRTKKCIDSILDKTNENGLWDNNLGKTARIINCLIENRGSVLKILGNSEDAKKAEAKLGKKIELGIIALRSTYSKSNWEENLITTANAINALVLYDRYASYKSKDFLKTVNDEARVASTYSSLKIALEALNKVIGDKNEAEKKIHQLTTAMNSAESAKAEAESKLAKAENKISKYETARKKSDIFVFAMTAVAVLCLLMIGSYYVYLYFESKTIFISILKQSFNWTNLILGAVVAAVMSFVPKFIIKWINKDIEEVKKGDK